MKSKKWIFQKGEQCPLSEVIKECNDHLPLVILKESKEEMVRRMEKYAPRTIVWSPLTERGWGHSRFNKNCWRTVEGDPIIPKDVTNSEKKIGAVTSSARRGYNLELKAPVGKFRVVGVDLFSHEDYLMGDYDSRAEAYKVADDHNTKRSGSMNDIYYVYDDQGTYIRGNEAVGQKISP